ncbi:MAG TPA: succinyldiaminopimelate transaminase, partial [Steroidobacteraceae bacterium]
PDGAFYLWPDVRGDDQSFTRQVHEQCNLTILPGSFVARDTSSGNPGVGRVRISLVPGVTECVEAAERLRDFLRRRPAQ